MLQDTEQIQRKPKNK